MYEEPFTKQWKKLGLDDDAKRRLENYLLGLNLKDAKDNKIPHVDVIDGACGAIKVRFNLDEHSGKSYGGRAIIVDLYIQDDVKVAKIHMLTAYSKRKKEDLTKKETEIIHDMVVDIKRQYRINKG